MCSSGVMSVKWWGDGNGNSNETVRTTAELLIVVVPEYRATKIELTIYKQRSTLCVQSLFQEIERERERGNL